MSYLAPTEFATKVVDAGESKLHMATRDVLIRAFMAGGGLGGGAGCVVWIGGETGGAGFWGGPPRPAPPESRFRKSAAGPFSGAAPSAPPPIRWTRGPRRKSL